MQVRRSPVGNHHHASPKQPTSKHPSHDDGPDVLTGRNIRPFHGSGAGDATAGARHATSHGRNHRR
jgi:hypothetical protein